MPTPPSYPGVYVEEIPSGVRMIVGVATSITLFVGWAPSGPVDEAVRLSGPADFERLFGGLDSRSLLGYSVRHFYDNGGSDAYVLRIATSDREAPIGPDHADFLSALTVAFAAGGPVDRIDLLNLLCVPGLVDGATVAMLQRRAHERRAFLILDCARDDTVATVSLALTGRTGENARDAAIYFPWVRAADPLQQNAFRPFPPCGFVAGIFARTDISRGVWHAPAGIDAGIRGAAGLTVTINDAENGLLNPRAINCLRTFPVNGTVIWGARTLDGDDDRASDWKYVPVRRLALFIEESLSRGLQWVSFEPNDERLWAQIRLAVGAFLQGLFRQGAFQGSSPDQAYFVRCDGGTTTQTDIDAGVVNILIGFAPFKPAEFIMLTIEQTAGNVVA